MRYRQLNFQVDSVTLQNLHNIMDTIFVREDGLQKRFWPGSKRSEFYRRIIDLGIEAITMQMQSELEKFKDESLHNRSAANKSKTA